MSPKNGTTVDLTVPSSSDPMSVNNTDNELVSTIAPIETAKPSSQPYTATSYSSSYTPITDSTYAIYPSAAFPAS